MLVKSLPLLFNAGSIALIAVFLGMVAVTLWVLLCLIPAAAPLLNAPSVTFDEMEPRNEPDHD